MNRGNPSYSTPFFVLLFSGSSNCACVWPAGLVLYVGFWVTLCNRMCNLVLQPSEYNIILQKCLNGNEKQEYYTLSVF